MPFTATEHAAAIDAAPELRDYDLTVQTSPRRKRTSFSAAPGEKTITVAVPATMTPEELVMILTTNRHTLDGLLSKAAVSKPPQKTTKQLVDGELFPLLGKNLPLRLVANGSFTLAGLLTREGEQVLSLSRPAAERRNVRPLVDFYSRVGTTWLREEAPALWDRLAPGRKMPEIVAEKIGNSRLGVYDTYEHKVRINWQTLQLPEDHVRHVLLHELVHATRPVGPSHGPRFWAIFRRLNPAAEEDEQAMRCSPAARGIWRGDLR